MNILFVCTGNTCRSPMAEGILKDMARKASINLTVKSAGVFAYNGDSASSGAVEAMEEIGIDISHHKATSIHTKLMEEADLILTMGGYHKQTLVSRFPHTESKIFSLKEYIYGINEDIQDPFGQGKIVYNRTRDEIKEDLIKFMEKIGG